jgi:hypothetical protein
MSLVKRWTIIAKSVLFEEKPIELEKEKNFENLANSRLNCWM